MENHQRGLEGAEQQIAIYYHHPITSGRRNGQYAKDSHESLQEPSETKNGKLDEIFLNDQ